MCKIAHFALTNYGTNWLNCNGESKLPHTNHRTTSHRRPEACTRTDNQDASHGGAIYMAAKKKTAKKASKKKTGAKKKK